MPTTIQTSLPYYSLPLRRSSSTIRLWPTKDLLPTIVSSWSSIWQTNRYRSVSFTWITCSSFALSGMVSVTANLRSGSSPTQTMKSYFVSYLSHSPSRRSRLLTTKAMLSKKSRSNFWFPSLTSRPALKRSSTTQESGIVIHYAKEWSVASLFRQRPVSTSRTISQASMSSWLRGTIWSLSRCSVDSTTSFTILRSDKVVTIRYFMRSSP